MVQDVLTVLDSLIPKEAEVQTKEGQWYLMRILPYRTVENVIEGAVLTFVDITERKQLERQQRLAIVVRDSSDAITVQDFEGAILAWNPMLHVIAAYQSVIVHRVSPDFSIRLSGMTRLSASPSNAASVTMRVHQRPSVQPSRRR